VLTSACGQAGADVGAAEWPRRGEMPRWRRRCVLLSMCCVPSAARRDVVAARPQEAGHVDLHAAGRSDSSPAFQQRCAASSPKLVGFPG
jgi:hypothetical protein